MKTLPIDQIQLEDSFLKENENLLPDGFTWCYNVINESVKKEDRKKYPNTWFLFDKVGNLILQYNEKTKTIDFNYEKIWIFLECELGLNYRHIKHLFKLILEQHVNCKVDTMWCGVTLIMSKFNKQNFDTIDERIYQVLFIQHILERHFRNR